MGRLIVLAALVVLAMPCMAFAQQAEAGRGTTVQLPRLDFTTVSSTVSVPDGGVVLIGSRRIGTSVRRSSRDVLARRNVPNQVCQTTKVDGVTTYDVVYDNNPVTLVVHDDGRIRMTVVREYSSDDIDELREHHPDILMHVQGFPTTSHVNTTIRLTIEAKSTFEFASEAELAKSDPDLREIFRFSVEHASPSVMITVTPRIIIQEEEEERLPNR